jgi:hypothetical protein
MRHIIGLRTIAVFCKVLKKEARVFSKNFCHPLRDVSCIISYKKRSKMLIFHVCIWTTLLNPSLDSSCVS